MKPGDIVYTTDRVNSDSFSPNTMTVFVYVGAHGDAHHLSVLFDLDDSFREYALNEREYPYEIDMWDDTILSRLADHPGTTVNGIIDLLVDGSLIYEGYGIEDKRNLNSAERQLLANCRSSERLASNVTFKPFMNPETAFHEMLAVSYYARAVPIIHQLSKTSMTEDQFERIFRSQLKDFFLEHTKGLERLNIHLPSVNLPSTSL